ncbi:hypothetical protein LCGC14_2226630 [marine sediment metagenome]|uniref:Thioredoxin domain-containing protein n=1 Tax=marine sediment metagenome TaxID=412755 RepID=A0A0F9D9K7_9ZZZZ
MNEIKSTQQFDDEVLNSSKPVFVDFWAEWCGPCKMIAPLLEELAEEMDGQLTIGKLDVYAVQSEPKPFGGHLRIQRFSQQMGLQGVKEVSDLPLGAYNMLAMHLSTAAIDKVEILANNVKVIEMDKVIRDAHQKVIERVPQAGMTHIDFLTERRLGEALYMGLTDFRAKLEFTADNVNYKLYAVSMQGVA